MRCPNQIPPFTLLEIEKLSCDEADIIVPMVNLINYNAIQSVINGFQKTQQDVCTVKGIIDMTLSYAEEGLENYLACYDDRAAIKDNDDAANAANEANPVNGYIDIVTVILSTDDIQQLYAFVKTLVAYITTTNDNGVHIDDTSMKMKLVQRYCKINKDVEYPLTTSTYASIFANFNVWSNILAAIGTGAVFTPINGQVSYTNDLANLKKVIATLRLFVESLKSSKNNLCTIEEILHFNLSEMEKVHADRTALIHKWKNEQIEIAKEVAKNNCPDGGC
jgi:hypothetical protein